MARLRRLWIVLPWLLAPPAAAQQPPPAEDGRPYGGVVPGTGHIPPHIEAARAREAKLLTWPGFQMRPDGASRFFVQTSAPVQIESRQLPGRFEVVLAGTGIFQRNNRRPLETRYFNAPVERARVERRGKDVAFVLDLRADVTPTVRTETGQGGFHYVFVEFPPGQYGPSDPQGGPAESP